MKDNPSNRKQFTLEMTEKRQELIEKLEDKILPRIGKSSTSAAIEESFRLSLEYINKLEKVEDEINKEKESWSTKNFKLQVKE